MAGAEGARGTVVGDAVPGVSWGGITQGQGRGWNLPGEQRGPQMACALVCNVHVLL